MDLRALVLHEGQKIAETLMLLGYKSSEEDADVWMKQDFNPNGHPYYK